MLRTQNKHKATHKWTVKSRVILLILKTFYSRKDTTMIWNCIFSDRLAAEGFRGGIPPTRLDAQFQEVKNGGKGFHFYTQVHDATVPEIQSLFPAYWAEIQAAVRMLKLDTTQKDKKSNFVLSRQAARRTRERAQVTTAPSQEASAHHEHETQSIRVRPSLQQFAYQESPYFNIGHTHTGGNNQNTDLLSSQGTISSKSTAGKVAKPTHRPSILYRATPNIAAFRSRFYTDMSVPIKCPPVFGTQAFTDLVWPHLQRDKKYERSPFISLAQNPHNALRRVELARSEQIDQKMFLVIFSFEDLVQDGIKQFGTVVGPYLVRSLFTAHEVSELPDGYKGAGEFLVYGAITCEPIAILESFQAIQLAKALRRFKIGDTDALLNIYESLQQVPPTWKAIIATQFLTRYCGRTRVPQNGTLAYDALIRVIFEGTEESLYMYKSERALNNSNKDSDDDDQEYMALEAEAESAIGDQQDTAGSVSQADAISQEVFNAYDPYQDIPQPPDDLASGWVVVDQLNNIASGQHTTPNSGNLSVHHSIQLWSPSSAEGIDQYSEGLQAPQQYSTAVMNSSTDDWDSLDDLDFDCTEGLGSTIAKKATRVSATAFSRDYPVPSIEKTPTPGKSYSDVYDSA